MSFGTASRDHAGLMDGVYRWQRHIYDLTRKHYLLGRDRLILDLRVPAGGSVLELGCGTGRNIVLAARHYPGAEFFGVDISSEMLASAGKAIAKARLSDRVRLARDDATDFDARAHFGRATFDRVFISYSLSMIPDWTTCVAAGLDALAPGGSLHIVDFGRQENLPRWFRAALRGWLARFHVTPRDDLIQVLGAEAERTGATLSTKSLFRGYAVLATLRLRG